MITMKSTGQFKKSALFLNKILNVMNKNILDKYGKRGVEALMASTPSLSGTAARSWGYETYFDKEKATITWTNSDVEGGYSVIILLQYGHVSKSGGFVQGIDFINPALTPVFEQIKEDLWKEVKDCK